MGNRRELFSKRGRRLGTKVAAVVITAVVAGAVLSACSSSGSDVLLVGTYHGHKGQYSSIQAAVDAASPGDWILVAPGDYHETADHQDAPTQTELQQGGVGGVLITTSDITVRGMNRNTVVVDGTKPGSPECSSNPADQDFGIKGPGDKPYGRNGIDVFKANDVWIENLTVCNFLNGSGDAGNEIWWNGGDGTGKIGLTGYWGKYLTATSSNFGGESTAAAYGIFSSNSAGPAGWNQIYANNFNDSGGYVGACQQRCDVTIDNAWFEYNALGYSGTNSGGQIILENSRFDHNQDGADTNTAYDGDPPAPQNGNCPGQATSKVTGTRSCWVFIHNDDYDNNNGDVPAAGSAAAGPLGTGMTISGGRNDTIMDNTFTGNGAWGILFVPYPDSSPPVDHQTCSSTGGTEESPFGCVFDPEGDALRDNTFVNDGYFGNPSNGDFGQITLAVGKPRNCFSGNDAPAGSAPPGLEQSQPTCDGTLTTGTNTGGPLLDQVLCDTHFGGCPAGANYPKIVTSVHMRPLPSNLPTMQNPCSGVPANAWCPGGSSGYSLRGPRHGAGIPLAVGGAALVAAPAARRRAPVNRNHRPN
jgi:hypothetical protein